jgi:hypothetical protein
LRSTAVSQAASSVLNKFKLEVAGTITFAKALRNFWRSTMASIVRREKYERTAFGKLIKWAFIGFNIMMFIWIVSGLSAVSNMEVHSAAEEAGRAIGSAIGFAGLLTLWAIGDVILGILVVFSRGDKIIIEEAGGGFASDMTAGQSTGSFGNADALIAQFKAQKEVVDIRPAPHSPQSEKAGTFGKRR